MQAQRDNPECANKNSKPFEILTIPDFNLNGQDSIPTPSILTKGRKPRVAILREQGINGQIEMAAAFDAAGFQSVDVTMTDLIEARTDLGDFSGMVACGGFSYGDVLGAGAGWARSILYNPKLRLQFTKFFNRQDSFTLGVCNGCQMLSRLKDLIPGARELAKVLTNRSEQFEARLSTVEIIESNSLFLKNMEGFRLPIAVAHGQGRATINKNEIQILDQNKQISLRYVDNKTETDRILPNKSKRLNSWNYWSLLKRRSCNNYDAAS